MSKNKKLIQFIIITIFLVMFVFVVFTANKNTTVNSNKLVVVTTMYPLYDFVKNIGGDYVNVHLLIPPGVELHSFEPKPQDIITVYNSDMFVYMSDVMEPWVKDIVAGSKKDLNSVNAGGDITVMKQDDEYHEDNHHDNEHHDTEKDPHVWLDFMNAIIIVEKITHSLEEIDPENAHVYRLNSENYISQLRDLDALYMQTLSQCGQKTIYYAGHYAFGYMVSRYGLGYKALQGFSPDSEPSVNTIIDMLKNIKKDMVSHIFYEELHNSRSAEAIANEAQIGMLHLNSGHTVSKSEINTLSFISLMKKNLENLKIGLQCK